MKILMPIAASAVGACLTGVASGVLAMSTAQSRLPAILSWLLKPEPDLDGKLVLVCTGELPRTFLNGPRAADQDTTNTVDPAHEMRRMLAAEHDAAVVLIDLRLPPEAGERRRHRANEIAQSVPADFRQHLTHEHVTLADCSQERMEKVGVAP